MAFGSGDYRYEVAEGWGQLPDGWTWGWIPAVACDSRDRVFVYSRSEHPLVVFDRDGRFLEEWGAGVLDDAHGIFIDGDDNVFCTERNNHCIYKFNARGELVMTIGTPGKKGARDGDPFNLPTDVGIAANGDLFISDGYGNARVHKFTVGGEHLFSWGEYGTDPGQFNLPHSVCTDGDGTVYVADRESHRVQMFDDRGAYLDQWNDLHRPCGLHIAGDHVYIGQIVTELTVNADYPNLGCCVSVHDLSGRRLARLGDVRPGEGPGQFIAPHGLAVDSHGDIYVGEVSWAAYGRKLTPPREVRSFRKLVRVR